MERPIPRTFTRHRVHLFLSQQQLILYGLGSLTGAISGLLAVVFRLSVYGLTVMFSVIPNALGSSLGVMAGALGWVIIPVIGGLATSLLTNTVAPEAGGDGIPEVIESYSLRGGRMRSRITLVKTISAGLTIGSGGSAGREGPIGQIGAGTGSGLGQFLKLGPKETRTLVVCGLSSGIAATFESPLGGAIFGIEVLVGELTAVSVVPVILASVVAVAVAVGLFGGDAAAFESPVFSFSSYPELLLYLLMGLAFGILSKVWVRVLYAFEDLFERIRVSKYFRPALGGFFVGLVGAWVISLENTLGYTGRFTGGSPYVPAVMGSGYAFVNSALTLDPAYAAPVLALLLFGLLKILTTSLTIGSGGSGGVFAPTLFIGAGLGGAFGHFFQWLAPDLIPYPMAFALVGMAAMFAGSAHVPVTCIVMIMEMTGSYAMILPLMVAVSSSYILSTAVMKDSIYTEKLRRRGVNIRHGVYVDALKSVRVSQVMTRTPTVLFPEMTASDALHMLATTHHTKFPVVDTDGRIVGTVIAEVLGQHSDAGGSEYRVRDLMTTDFLKVTLDMTMDEVLHAMMVKQEGHAVILDPSDPTRMLGFLTKTDVFRAYEAAISALRIAGSFTEDYLVDVSDIT